jgi:hypothetical protein
MRGHSGGGADDVLLDVLLGGERTIVIQHKQPDCRRQIAVPALRIDTRNKIRQRYAALIRDLLEAFPESILKAHACLVSRDDNRSLHDR